MSLIQRYGEMWARNDKTIGKIPGKRDENGQGVYVLYDGSMPVYIGKGYLHSRINKARKGRKGDLWDYFSWYSISDESHRHDIEALLLRRLPWYLRALNQQSGKFRGATKVEQPGLAKDQKPDAITRKKKWRKRASKR